MEVMEVKYYTSNRNWSNNLDGLDVSEDHFISLGVQRAKKREPIKTKLNDFEIVK